MQRLVWISKQHGRGELSEGRTGKIHRRSEIDDGGMGRRDFGRREEWYGCWHGVFGV